MTESPSREFRQAVVDRLADESIGFNHYLSETATEYEATPFEIDFTGASANFFQAQINPRQLPDVTDLLFPALCVYGTKGENTGDRAIGSSFDGDVVVCVEVHLAWDGLESLVDFESRIDAVESALMSSLDLQMHPEGLAYSSYSFTRSPLAPSGSTWMSTFSLRLIANVTE